MLITPTRVVFEDRDRFSSITIVNTGTKTRTYNIGWIFFKMIEGAGNYENVATPPSDFDLSKHIVYSPRRVTLQPGVSQKVRLALRRPGEIPDGDYHIHLKFSVDPDAPEDIVDKQSEEISKGGGRSGAAVAINVSYSIPVILIVGKPNVTASIGDLEMRRNKETGGLHAVFPVERVGGAYSVLGHIYVYHTGADGLEELVGEISNAHIFPEVDVRKFDVALTKEVTAGKLRIRIEHYNKLKGIIYAERSFSLQ